MLIHISLFNSRICQLQIIKHKPKEWNGKSLRIDYHTSKIYNKVIFHLNEHSDGYVAHCYWIKLYSPLENSQFFNFTPFYTLKKKIYKQTIDNIYVYEDYIKGLP